jgi:hypothetical protein
MQCAYYCGKSPYADQTATHHTNCIAVVVVVVTFSHSIIFINDSRQTPNTNIRCQSNLHLTQSLLQYIVAAKQRIDTNHFATIMHINIYIVWWSLLCYTSNSVPSNIANSSQCTCASGVRIISSRAQNRVYEKGMWQVPRPCTKFAIYPTDWAS